MVEHKKGDKVMVRGQKHIVLDYDALCLGCEGGKEGEPCNTLIKNGSWAFGINDFKDCQRQKSSGPITRVHVCDEPMCGTIVQRWDDAEDGVRQFLIESGMDRWVYKEDDILGPHTCKENARS